MTELAIPAGVSHLKSPARSAASDNAPVAETVSEVLARVRVEGDAAVRDYAKRFDKSDLDAFEVSMADREAAVEALDPQTREDTEFAIENVRAFAKAQFATIGALDDFQPRPAFIWATASSRWNASAAMCRAGAIRCCPRRS